MILFLCVLCAILTFALYKFVFIPLNEPGRHLTDEEMIEKFNTHRDVFEEVASEGGEDYKYGIVRIAPDFVRYCDWFGDECEKDTSKVDVVWYRDQIEKLKLEAGLSFREDSVSFLDSTIGFSIGAGSTKGYIYSEEPLTNKYDENLDFQDEPYDNLDDFDKITAGDCTVYKQIDENWYLFYSYHD